MSKTVTTTFSTEERYLSTFALERGEDHDREEDDWCLTLTVLLCGGSMGHAELIAYRAFDEADGPTATEFVGGDDATLIGNASFAPDEGRFGRALDLRQNSFKQSERTDRVEFDSNEVFDTETFAISIWFNMAVELNPCGDPGIRSCKDKITEMLAAYTEASGRMCNISDKL